MKTQNNFNTFLFWKLYNSSIIINNINSNILYGNIYSELCPHIKN